MSIFIKPGYWLEKKKWYKEAFNLDTFVDKKIANIPTPGGVASVKTTEVVITPAQMLNIHNEPIVLIPAQGENTVIKILGVISYINFNTTYYAGTSFLYIHGTELMTSSDVFKLTGFNSSVTSFKNETTVTNNALVLPNNNVLLSSKGSVLTQGDSVYTLLITYAVHNI